MSAFDLANWMAILVSWTVIIIQLPLIEKSKLMLMLSFVMLLVPFAIVAKLFVLANLGTLLCSLTVLTSKKRSALAQIRLSMPLNGFGIAFLAALFVLPIVLQGAQGWLILLGLASKYWFLFSIAVLYSANRDNPRLKAAIAIISLLAGLLWNFKIAFAFFAFIAIHYIIINRSTKGLILFFVGVVASTSATYFLFLDAFLTFLEVSVLRPDYDYDSKIFGFSDGARLLIWSHYLENSIWVGRGDYYLPYTVPSHNIVVYLAHELGILGALIFGPIFVYFVVMIARRIGPIVALLFFLLFSLSSFGEYPSMWAYCVILAPVLFQSSVFHRKIVLFGNTQYG